MRTNDCMSLLLPAISTSGWTDISHLHVKQVYVSSSSLEYTCCRKTEVAKFYGCLHKPLSSRLATVNLVGHVRKVWVGRRRETNGRSGLDLRTSIGCQRARAFVGERLRQEKRVMSPFLASCYVRIHGHVSFCSTVSTLNSSHSLRATNTRPSTY